MIKDIQQTTGLLNFFNRAIVPGRTFTRRIYDNVKIKDKHGAPLKNHHHILLHKGLRLDCRVWLEFLSMSTKNHSLICRPFMDLDAILHVESIGFFSDASLNKDLGMGAIFGDRWIVYKWGSEFITKYEPSIEYLELYALVAGILTWSKKLQNCRILVNCDNESVVYMVNKLTSRCPQCMKLIRLLTLDGIISNRRVFVKHLRSEQNFLADSLSRMQFQHFWHLTPSTMMKFPDTIHKDIWPLEKLWNNSNI